MTAAAPASARRLGPLLALVLAAGFPYIGRSVTTADGAEVVSESLGLFVQGSFGLGRIPPADSSTPEMGPAGHSKYGLFPSLLPVPALAAVWPVRRLVGGAGVDAAIAATWTLGVVLAGLAFGRLVRTLRPDAAGPWEAAFVAGTFLWPYAADSFVEPFAAAGLAWGAALLLGGRPRAGAAAWGAAFLLKPVLWITAPAFLLALLLDEDRPRVAGNAARSLAVFALFLGLQGAANLAQGGTLLETGYGSEVLRFTTPLPEGLYGLLLSPGRSVFLYAPVALVGLVSLVRAPRRVAAICAGAPLVLLLVMARWWSWEGGASWGPRLLLPVLPLLAAPAAFAGRAVARAAFVAGALLNLAGVLVSPGSWDGYVDRLRPPDGVRWPAMGLVRVVQVPVLSPILGHAWLAARNVAGLDLRGPWLAAGASEAAPPPDAGASVSPWIVRRTLGLPAIPPMAPRLLVFSASGDAARGRFPRARKWLAEALLFTPGDPDARRLAAALPAP
jgi:hypothetical protein